MDDQGGKELAYLGQRSAVGSYQSVVGLRVGEFEDGEFFARLGVGVSRVLLGRNLS